MVLPVYVYGHPVLRREAEDIEPDYPELQKLVKDMFDTMYAAEGIGLAAPQIGLSIAVIVIDGSVLASEFPECADSKMVLINPQLDIIEDQTPVSRSEGCLSLPGLSENVKRSNGSTRISSRTSRNSPDSWPVSSSMSTTICSEKCSPTISHLSASK